MYILKGKTVLAIVVFKVIGMRMTFSLYFSVLFRFNNDNKSLKI
jgi:hypothetical protein